MDFQGHRAIINGLKRQLESPPSYESLSYLLAELRYTMEDNPDITLDGRDFVMAYSGYIKKWATNRYSSTRDRQWDKLYWDTLRFEAPYIFDSFLIYMERKRREKKKFYIPRRKTLKIVVDDLQDLEDRKIDFLGISLPPRVGKSTLCIFFMAWVMGKRPAGHNAMSGHSGILADRFYRDAAKLIESEEYTFREIFPQVRIANRSAEKNEMYLDAVESFATLTCRGIDGTWTGAVDISDDGYLYVDDLIRDRQESLSPTRLENRYQDYLNIS